MKALQNIVFFPKLKKKVTKWTKDKAQKQVATCCKADKEMFNGKWHQKCLKVNGGYRKKQPWNVQFV